MKRKRQVKLSFYMRSVPLNGTGVGQGSVGEEGGSLSAGAVHVDKQLRKRDGDS